MKSSSLQNCLHSLNLAEQAVQNLFGPLESYYRSFTEEIRSMRTGFGSLTENRIEDFVSAYIDAVKTSVTVLKTKPSAEEIVKESKQLLSPPMPQADTQELRSKIVEFSRKVDERTNDFVREFFQNLYEARGSLNDLLSQREVKNLSLPGLICYHVSSCCRKSPLDRYIQEREDRHQF